MPLVVSSPRGATGAGTGHANCCTCRMGLSGKGNLFAGHATRNECWVMLMNRQCSDTCAWTVLVHAHHAAGSGVLRSQCRWNQLPSVSTPQGSQLPPVLLLAGVGHLVQGRTTAVCHTQLCSCVGKPVYAAMLPCRTQPTGVKAAWHTHSPMPGHPSPGPATLSALNCSNRHICEMIHDFCALSPLPLPSLIGPSRLTSRWTWPGPSSWSGRA
jgi:hypothetical protein